MAIGQLYICQVADVQLAQKRLGHYDFLGGHMSTPTTAANALVVVLCIMFGLLVGLSAGIVTWFSKKSLPAAILAGGSAFGGTVALGLLVKSALGY